MHNHRLTPWVSLYRDFCDATSDPLLVLLEGSDIHCPPFVGFIFICGKEQIVSPELAQNIMTRLRQGEIVEFPNRYELSQVKGKFGGCFMD
jgi:hypothetical protein